MKLLLDEMFPAALASELRNLGHDVFSIHDVEYQHLLGADDEEVFAGAIADDRVIVTENIADFLRLEVNAISQGAPSPRLIFTTDRRFPRGRARTFGRLVQALGAVLALSPEGSASFFLEDPKA